MLNRSFGALLAAMGASIGIATQSISMPGTFRLGTRKRRNRTPMTRKELRERGDFRRLDCRAAGGNWKGTQYLSYAEHDRCKREMLEHVAALELDGVMCSREDKKDIYASIVMALYGRRVYGVQS